MTETQAKRQMTLILATLTAGSVLHLLAELFAEQAEAARRTGDALAAERCGNVAATLFVVGIGIDAACPR